MSFLTIFTAPKPFTNPHIALIQRNAIRSWLQLDYSYQEAEKHGKLSEYTQSKGSAIEVILLGEETGLAEVSAELGVKHIPDVKRNSLGTPLVSSMFDQVRKATDSPYLGCVNADILFLPDVLLAVRRLAAQKERFLMVGQRWDLEVKELLDFSPGWDTRLINQLQSEGKLHPRGGSDYFIFPRQCFTEIPDFTIGRAGWDNWMIYEARSRGWLTVDCTQDLNAVHQNHDYSHLPNGQPHYRLPETAENVRLAGGRMTIFTIQDTNRQLINGRIVSPRMEWRKLWREVEIYPLVGLHSMILGWLFYHLFHPLKAYEALRHWLVELKGRIR